MTLDNKPYNGSWQDYIKIVDNGRDNQNILSKILGKLRLYLKKFDLLIIAFLVVITFFFGFVGFRQQNPNKTIISIIYSILRLFILEGDFTFTVPYELEIARFSAPLVLAYAGIKAGMTIFQDKIQDFELRFLKEHVIICGLGEKGFQLVQDIKQSNRKVVVIEKNRENQNWIHLKTSNVIVVQGDATEKAILRKVRIHEAKYIITVCGDDQVNVEVAVNAYNLLNSIIEKEFGVINWKNIAPTKTHKIKCFVHLVNPQLKKMLKSHTIFTDQFDIFDLVFFNSFENASRLVFRNYPVDKLAVINLSLDQVHLVIIGLGRMGQSILIQAAKICHYTTRIVATITIIDKDAKNKLEMFFHEYPNLERILKCNYEQINVLSPELKNAKFWNSNPEPTLFIVCLNNDINGITASLSLLTEMKGNKKPILVRLKENAGFTTLLNEPDFNSKNPIYPFGMTSEILSQDILVNESLDALAIAINNDWYTSFSEDKLKHQYKDPLALWYSLSEELKESNRQQADHIDIKLRRINCKVVHIVDKEIEIYKFKEDELEELSHLEHKRWMAERLLAGWKYGEKRNNYKKENPILVPWENLPEETKELNRRIIRNIPILLSKYNLELQKDK